MIRRRDIVVTVILSIVTCGIYWLYWMAKMNDDSLMATQDTQGTSGGMVVLLSIVTCGIYSYYWYYNMGRRMQAAMANHGLQGEDRSVLYIVLALLQLSIVNDCLIQSDLNRIADSTNGGNFNTTDYQNY